MSSIFDSDTFLGQEYSGKLDDVMTPVPTGVYTAVIDRYGISQIQRDDGSEPLVLEITWAIDDPDEAVKRITKRKRNSVRQSGWIEDLTTNAQGALTVDVSPGCNVRLGQFLSAVGLNTGSPWSWSQLQGKAAKVEVNHTVSKKDGEVYANVKTVHRL